MKKPEEKKRSKTETGDAVNIGSMRRLIDFCTALGIRYNPSNQLIIVANMQGLLNQSELAVANLNALNTPARNAINAREIAFKPVSKLMTRVANETRASDVSKEFILDVVNLVKKINGVRVIPKVDQDPNLPPELMIKYISASQMGFDNRIANIDELVSLLTAETHYAPSEPDLSATALTTMVNGLKAKHAAVSAANAQMVVARNAKNDVLYRESDGEVETAGICKKYIKAVFGAKSAEYREAAKIKFRKMKK